jgi:hypothetical protein
MRAQASKTNRKMKQVGSGVSAMLANSTRLELVIVAAMLLVLMLCNRSPRSGNAEVLTGREEVPSPVEKSTRPVSAVTEARMQSDAETVAPDELPPIDMKPRVKRVGIVDARNSGNPKYKDLMYGEVTVRSIWNGGRFVWKKVCVVDEGNGVTSVWSFDQQDGVTITEREEPVTTP